VKIVRLDRAAVLLALSSLAAIGAKLHLFVGFHSGG
jgi:hypothetical protein